MLNTTKLVSAVEMQARFARIVSPEIIIAEKEFYDTLVSYADDEIDAKRLTFVLFLALERRSPLVPINISDHLEAMIGDRNNPVFQEAHRTLENVAARMANAS